MSPPQSFSLLLLLSLLASTALATSPPPSSHSLTGPILSSLGFLSLSSAASAALSNATVAASPWKGPITVFAPSDSSLAAATCHPPDCSLSLLLQQHTLPGLFPLPYLLSLPFGTKIESLSPNRCLTITTSSATSPDAISNATSKPSVFISGMKIERPDMYSDGHVTVHGLEGYVTPLSPMSCDAHRATSLMFPQSGSSSYNHHHHHNNNNYPKTTPFYFTKMMLKDAMLRLGISGYAVVSLALRVKYADLVTLSSMTIFALDDASIFSGAGHDYVTHFRAHVIPNKMLTAADLAALPAGTVLPTMYDHRKLVVTSHMRLNYVKMRTLDMIFNLRIIVHSLSVPFPAIDPTVVSDFSKIGVSEFDHPTVSPAPAIGSVVENVRHHGL